VSVVDVVPLDPDDPRGAGFGAGFLPLAMTGLLAGAPTFTHQPAWQRTDELVVRCRAAVAQWANWNQLTLAKSPVVGRENVR
jgi:hypothetical protein